FPVYGTMFAVRRAFGVAVTSVLLVSCGGGDDDGSPSAPSAGAPPAANSPPVISGNPQTSVMQGTQFSFVPTAADADGDALTFTVENAPRWATFDSVTGRLQGTPSAADVGAYANIRIGVSDGRATTALASFSIQVVA